MNENNRVVNSHQDVFDAVEEGIKGLPWDIIEGPLRSAAAGASYWKEYTYRGRSFEVCDEMVRTKMLVTSVFPGGPTLSFRPKFEVLSCSNGMIADEISQKSGEILLVGAKFEVVKSFAESQFLAFGDGMIEAFKANAEASRKALLKEAEEVLRGMIQRTRKYRDLGSPYNPITNSTIGLVMGHLKEQNRWGLAMALGEAAKDVFPLDVFESLMLQRLAHGIITEAPSQHIPIAVRN